MSTNGRGPNSYRSTPTIPSEIDWTQVSPRGRAIARRVAIPYSMGFSVREIAKLRGTTTNWVLDRLDELRSELEHLS